MKHIVILSIMLIGFSSCLRNLNQSEYFRKLKIKKESWYDIITANPSKFEASVEEYIEGKVGPLEMITFWGEGRYACGRVVKSDSSNREVLQILGVYFVKGEKQRHLYNIQFVPKEDGELDLPILYN